MKNYIFEETFWLFDFNLPVLSLLCFHITAGVSDILVHGQQWKVLQTSKKGKFANILPIIMESLQIVPTETRNSIWCSFLKSSNMFCFMLPVYFVVCLSFFVTLLCFRQGIQ